MPLNAITNSPCSKNILITSWILDILVIFNFSKEQLLIGYALIWIMDILKCQNLYRIIFNNHIKLNRIYINIFLKIIKNLIIEYN